MTTVTIETIANVAPVDKVIDVWASLTDSGGGTITWSSDMDTPAQTGAPFVVEWIEKSSNIGDLVADLARGQLKVPGDLVAANGQVRISITATRDNGDNGQQGITFINYDNPDNPEEAASLTEIQSSAIVVDPFGFPSQTFDTTNTIEYTCGLFYAIPDDAPLNTQPQPIVGAEIDFYITSDVSGTLWRNATFGTGLQAKNGAWGKAVTAADGFARIRVASLKTSMVRLYATTLGLTNAPQASGYFISLDDERPATIWSPVGISLGGDAKYHIAPGDREFSLDMPPVNAVWSAAGYHAWLYMEGNGRHILEYFDVVDSGASKTFQFSDAFLNLTQSAAQNDNKVIFFVQGRGNVSKSYLTQFDVVGTFVNAPDPSVNRDEDLPLCQPNPYVKPSGYFVNDDIINGLTFQISQKLPAKYDGYELFFNYYINGFRGQTRHQDFKTRPKPGSDQLGAGIPVKDTTDYYSATLEKGFVDNIKDDGFGNFLRSYFEYYLRKPGDALNPDAWVYSPYVLDGYYFNT